MRAVCISETKWFASDMYNVDGFTVLHSSHELPHVLQHCKGVQIVSCIKFRVVVVTRIVSVRIQLSDNYLSGSQQCVSIISVYVPTHAGVKQKFYDDLQFHYIMFY